MTFIPLFITVALWVLGPILIGLGLIPSWGDIYAIPAILITLSLMSFLVSYRVKDPPPKAMFFGLALVKLLVGLWLYWYINLNINELIN